MESEKYSGLTMDFKNLMSCIQCHEDSANISIILETLKTIVDICTNEECGKDAFREEGGLDFLMEFVSTTDSTILLEHSLKTLALVVDENVHSQMHMTKIEFFEILQVIIRKTTFPSSVLKNALLFSASVLFQNSLAQSLISKSGFLQDLINIYDNSAPSHLNSTFTKPTLYDSSGDVWISANSALCFAVNNPQNEENQVACSVLFPLSLKLLESSSDYIITSAVSSFLSLCVANNANNQRKFAEYDGLLVLKRCFQRHFDSMELDIKEFNSVIAKSNLQSINNFIGVISAVASENDKNAAFLGKLGVLTLMVKLLTIGVPDDQLQTRIILALAYCIDAQSNCKSYVLRFADFHNFLRKNFEKGNTELVSASKYLLQVCLNEEGTVPLSDANILQDDNSDLFSSVSERGSVVSKHKMNPQKTSTGKNIHANSSKQSCDQFLNSTVDKKNFNKTCDSEHTKNLFSNNCKVKTLDRKNESFTPETFKLPDYEFYLSHKHLKAHEHHHKTKDKRNFKSSCSKYRKKLYSESCYCSSIKSYTNSKHENILLLKKDPKSHCENFQKCKRKSCNCGEAFPSSNASPISVEFGNKSENCGSCRESFQSINKHETNYPTGKPVKKLKNGSEKSFITNFSKVVKKFKPILAEETNHPFTSKTHFDKDFNPFSIPIIDELKENMNSGFTKFDNSKCELDLLPDISDSHNDILRSNDRNFFSKLDDRNVKDIRNDNLDDYLDSSLDFQKNEIFQLKNSGGLLDSSCMESMKDAEIKNAVPKHKKLRRSDKMKSRNTVTETHKKNKSQLDSDDFDSYVQVIVFPSDSCEQHRLITNFEMLKVKSLKESAIV